MDLIIFFILPLVGFFLGIKFLLAKGNQGQAKKELQDPWSPWKTKDVFKKESSQAMQLDEKNGYIWNLNDSFKYFNNQTRYYHKILAQYLLRYWSIS